MEENVAMFAPEEIPQTDTKKAKVSINILQENLARLMTRDGLELAAVQKKTGIAWGTLYGYCKGAVTAQILDLNIKELADCFDISVDFLAFGLRKYEFDTFDKEELKKRREK